MKYEYLDPWNYAGKTHLLKFVLSGLPWNFLLKTQLGVCIHTFSRVTWHSDILHSQLTQESNIFYNSSVPFTSKSCDKKRISCITDK